MARAVRSTIAVIQGAALCGLALLFALPAATEDSEARLQNALKILGATQTGKGILERAPEGLIGRLHWGNVSRTDAVLTRNFNPRTGKENRTREITVYLKSDQALPDLVLDLAHELTHATAGPSWDPYDPELTAGKYILASIESEGGEIDALVAECSVAAELHEVWGTASIQRCRRYLDDGQIRRARVRKDFYRVGTQKASLVRELGAETELFPELTDETPELFSSTGQAPYPQALLKEFQEITQIACENSKKRLRESSRRSVASRSESNQNLTERFLNSRCALSQAGRR